MGIGTKFRIYWLEVLWGMFYCSWNIMDEPKALFYYYYFRPVGHNSILRDLQVSSVPLALAVCPTVRGCWPALL
jgi:hypothetical protein